MILTNPPFGGEEEQGIQGNFPEDMQTAETALLFLQLIMRKLKRRHAGERPAGRPWSCPTARCSATASARASRRICSRIQPPHHRAAAERRLRPVHQHPDQPAVLRPLRADQGNLVLRAAAAGGPKNYTKTKPIQYEEFSACLEWWNKRKENDRAWRVPVEQIIESGYNLDLKNPNGIEAAEHPPPEQLVEDISQRNDGFWKSWRRSSKW